MSGATTPPSDDSNPEYAGRGGDPEARLPTRGEDARDARGRPAEGSTGGRGDGVGGRPDEAGTGGNDAAGNGGGTGGDGAGGRPSARVRRRRFSLVWLIPLVAVGIAIYLGVQALNNRGPLITISFKTGDGLTAGQTQVKHKAVALGTVEDVRLNDKLSGVDVRVRLNGQGARVITDHARFWVVRPRFNAGSVSGSGDPGLRRLHRD